MGWKTAYRSFYYATAEEPDDIILDPEITALLVIDIQTHRICFGISDAFGGSGFPPGIGAEGAVVPVDHKPFATTAWRKYAPS